MIPDNFVVGAIGSLMFGLIGIILFITGYFAFDLLTPKLDISKELSNGNVSVGIVVAALLLAIALVISSVVH